MINLNNYESWFLQYADGECTPAEQQAVEGFLLLHPALKEELDQMLDLRLSPDKVVMPGKEFLRFAELEVLNEQYRLEPDLSIEYADKTSLYKKERVGFGYLYRAISAAAVLLFGIGLYWMLSDEPVQQDVVSGPQLVQPEMRSVEDKASPVEDGNPVELKQSRSNSLPINSKPTLIAAVSPGIPEQKEKELYTEMVAQVEEPLSIQIVEKPISNLSEEVLKAAAIRLEPAHEADQIATPINASVLINDANKTNDKKTLRSLARTLSRRILHDEEEDGNAKFIQVANFHIHVKH